MAEMAVRGDPQRPRRSGVPALSSSVGRIVSTVVTAARVSLPSVMSSGRVRVAGDHYPDPARDHRSDGDSGCDRHS